MGDLEECVVLLARLTAVLAEVVLVAAVEVAVELDVRTTRERLHDTVIVVLTTDLSIVVAVRTI